MHVGLGFPPPQPDQASHAMCVLSGLLFMKHGVCTPPPCTLAPSQLHRYGGLLRAVITYTDALAASGAAAADAELHAPSSGGLPAAAPREWLRPVNASGAPPPATTFQEASSPGPAAADSAPRGGGRVESAAPASSLLLGLPYGGAVQREGCPLATAVWPCQGQICVLAVNGWYVLHCIINILTA
jgi:hypothetical protein